MAKRRRSKTGWLVAAVIVVIVALVAAFAVLRGPSPGQNQPLPDYDAALAAYNQAVSDLANQLDTAQDVMLHVDFQRMADASDENPSADALQAAIDAVPAVEAAPAGVHQLVAATAELADANAQLAAGVDAVCYQQIAWARVVLTTAISQGKLRAMSWSDTTDSRLSDLQQRLDAAQQLLDGLDGADPADVGQQAWEAALAVTSTIQQFDGSDWGEALGVYLPGGVDDMVIQGDLPADAIDLPTEASGIQVFQTPGADVGCASFPGTAIVTCEIANPTWTAPPVLAAICAMAAGDQACGQAIFEEQVGGVVSLVAPTEAPPWATAKASGLPITTLEFGQVANWYPITCLSASDGVTCWDITTFHGFKISPSRVQYW